MEKPEIIKRLEKQTGKELKKLDIENIFGITNCYVINESGNIVGLNLYKVKISDISFLKDFLHLTHLDLSSNQIADISPINQITGLEELYLSNNQILDISVLKKLTNLKLLALNDNEIFDISALSNIKELKRLDLRYNKISQIPIDMLEMGMEIKWEFQHIKDGIYLNGNPLETPPIEIVMQGNEAVRNYFKELRKKSVRLLQSKLLIVGNGEVGKTTLMKKLKDSSFQVEVGKEPSTHGINIIPWEMDCYFDTGSKLELEKVKLHLWDFGGQDIYHATHQFFLTKRSLYLFVWEARKEEESRSFDYWLNIIKLLSANSPVIVVMNKSDVRIKHIDEGIFKEKFINIMAFFQVSCLTGDGIEKLTRQIRLSLNEMPHLRDKLPKVWVQIRDHLKNRKKDYISLNDYFGICQNYGLNEERAEFLSSYLHDLGVILHYRHDELLENIVILNPEWATEAVYTLIDTREILENKGRFQFDKLKTYWDLNKFPRDKHAELVRLMEKFELCFPITGTDFHIVPELLPTNRPQINTEIYKKTDNLHFEYHYDFMPEGIITRFISRMYYLIKDDHFWKNGVELRFEDSKALVISELLNRKMKISVTGSCKSELLAIIRNDFEHIHNTLNMEKNRHYHEMLPCTCSICIQSPKPHLYKHDVLQMFSRKGVPNFCQVSGAEVPVDKLLKGYEPPKPKKDLLKTLITTTHHLQGISKTIKPEEDSRNGFIALLLSIHGFYIKDQTRWGRSASGKSMGEVDIKIENLEREAEAIIEAFNLKGFDRTVIDSHLKKLFGYDPSGLVHNYIVVYSEVEDFLDLWQKYLNHLPEIDFKHKLIENPEEQKTRFAEIKLACAKHRRQGKETNVYHLFVNMKP
jgi:small GTP-binding protein